MKREIAGFGLIDAMVSLAALSALALAMGAQMQTANKNQKFERSVSSRDKVLSTVRNVAGMASALRISQGRTGNEPLLLCTIPMYVFTTGIPGDCQSGREFSLILYGPVLSQGASGQLTSGAITGTPVDPMKFDWQGVPCTASSPDVECPFELMTTFKAQCPVRLIDGKPVSICDVAELIEVKYELRPTTLYSKDPSLRVIQGSIVTEVAKISGYGPAANPIVIPPPPPITASTTPTTAPSTTTVAALPPPPITCIGDTFQSGPGQCSCPSGTVLVRPSTGGCGRLSL